jgi:hypothetical protein
MWEQEPNPRLTTSVVYTIFVERARFVVQGKDEEDGEPLEVSRIRWDGESLHFTTVFRPTRHKSSHVLTALSKRKMSQHVSSTYADGEAFSGEEIWRKRRAKQRMN